jgi:hypothetical protein
MAIHKRIKIASGSAVPTAGQQQPQVDASQYDKAEHFNQMARRRPRHQPSQMPPRRNWKKIIMMILILLVASYLIYMLVKGSKSSPLLSASAKPSTKVFYF